MPNLICWEIWKIKVLYEERWKKTFIQCYFSSGFIQCYFFHNVKKLSTSLGHNSQAWGNSYLDNTMPEDLGIDLPTTSNPKIILTSWTKPPHLHHKLHVDGALKSSASLSRGDATLRNDKGIIIFFISFLLWKWSHDILF